MGGKGRGTGGEGSIQYQDPGAEGELKSTVILPESVLEKERKRPQSGKLVIAVRKERIREKRKLTFEG